MFTASQSNFSFDPDPLPVSELELFIGSLCPLNGLSLAYSEANQEGEGGGESSKESAPYLGQALCWLTSHWWEGK